MKCSEGSNIIPEVFGIPLVHQASFACSVFEEQGPRKRRLKQIPKAPFLSSKKVAVERGVSSQQSALRGLV